LRRRSLRGEPAIDAGRQAVVDILSRSGKSLRSVALTALANQIAQDPFAKIKVLIQELIERLLTETSKEADHKGWCDKATKDAKQKRDYAAQEVRGLNDQMAMLEALRDKLGEELSVLSEEILELETSQNETTVERKEESQENNQTVIDAQDGMTALDDAMTIISRFYKTVAKETVDLSLAQKGPAEDAPDAGFKNGEAYVGGQGQAEGILGMMDVMKSDFARTISETKAAEEAAEEEYMRFMTETSKSLAQKNEASSARAEQKQAAEVKLGEDDDTLAAQTDILDQKIKELLDLKPVCVDVGMSYADRVARREDEIKSLEQALCILKAFEQYGPEGLADAC